MNARTYAVCLAALLSSCETVSTPRLGLMPIPGRTIVARHAPDGTLKQTRIDDFDRFGRVQRWEERDGSGRHELTWVGIYLGTEAVPARAAYWSGVGGSPARELAVASPDNRFHDVYYADAGEKPRRQLRQYVDAAGREIYQEYFAPKSQRKYSEEFYSYDDNGNELGRTWRRLDGKAQRVTRFEITERDEFGRWVERRVFVDDKLDAVDHRHIDDSDTSISTSPASAGPIEPSTVILPVPLAPGTIASTADENMLTFGPDGTTVVFTRHGEDWQTQQPFFALFRDGAWREPEPAAFAKDIYNAALSAAGDRIVFCRRNDAESGGARAFVVARTAEGWSQPVDLTASQGFRGSYFCLVGTTLWFHRDGDLYRCTLDTTGKVREEVRLAAPINTTDGVEFAPWVNADESLLLFTRGVESATQRSGLFASRRAADGSWGEPTRLPLPYGWGAAIHPNGEDLVYCLEGDPCRVPVVLLGWK